MGERGQPNNTDQAIPAATLALPLCVVFFVGSLLASVAVIPVLVFAAPAEQQSRVLHTWGDTTSRTIKDIAEQLRQKPYTCFRIIPVSGPKRAQRWKENLLLEGIPGWLIFIEKPDGQKIMRGQLIADCFRHVPLTSSKPLVLPPLGSNLLPQGKLPRIFSPPTAPLPPLKRPSPPAESGLMRFGHGVYY